MKERTIFTRDHPSAVLSAGKCEIETHIECYVEPRGQASPSPKLVLVVVTPRRLLTKPADTRSPLS
jgi:hypothetical protein